LWLTLLQVSQSIQSWNNNQPLWNHQIGDLSYDFRIQWELKWVNELQKIPIQTANSFVFLEDISHIEYRLKDENIKWLWAFQLSWQRYVSLNFNKSIWANLFSSAQEAKKIFIDEFNKIEYDDLQYLIAYDMSEFIAEDNDTLWRNWLMTLVFVFLVLLLFVGFKESIIATVTIPLAFFVTFFVLKSLNLSLNFLTNFSFIVTFGIAIDTTIVVIEWAHERIRQWFKPKNAILMAVRDYKYPLIAGTSTTLVVFLPLLSLPGVMWKFLAYIPITIFATLLAALIISLTVNSALYYKLSKSRKHFEDKLVDKKYMTEGDLALLDDDRKWKTEKPEKKKNLREKILDKVSSRYWSQLEKIMRNEKTRRAAITISVLLFISSVLLVSPQLWFTLFPDNDNGFVTLTLESQKWTDREHMLEFIDDIEWSLSKMPEIKLYNYEISPWFISTNIELLPVAERKKNRMRDVFELENILDEELDFLRSQWYDLKIIILNDWPPSDNVIGVKLVTDDNQNFELLQEVAWDFESYLNRLNWTKNIQMSSQKSPGQFVFSFDKSKLTMLWLSPSDLNFELFASSNEFSAGSLKWPYDYHDIKLKYMEFDEILTPSDISNLSINTHAWPVLMGNVSDYQFVNAIDQIQREDTKIMISVGWDVVQNFKINEVQAKLIKFAKEYTFPDWIYYEAGGETEENMGLIVAMLSAFLMSILLIYGILVLMFNSFTQPIIIMFSLLMGVFGANLWLLITGNPYGLMFIIWFIALTGIVVNDAIVFLDRTNKNVKKWMNRLDAVVEAWKARLHPIILTTITTIVGLISISSNPMRQPLAVTVMFGIFFWSAMTLFVIPAIYYDRHKITHLIKRAILHPLFVLFVFVSWLAGLFTIWYLLRINFWKVDNFRLYLAIAFAVYLVGYSFYNIYAQYKYQWSFLRKILKLNITNNNWKNLNLKQALHRFLLKKMFFWGPALLWTISYMTIKTITDSNNPVVWFILNAIIGIVILSYFVIITYYLRRYWKDDNNDSFHDEIVGADVHDLMMKENNQDLFVEKIWDKMFGA